jgi:hypothetical protein
MALATEHNFEWHWNSGHDSLTQEHKNLVNKYPDANEVIKQVIKVYIGIVSFSKCTPEHVG